MRRGINRNLIEVDMLVHLSSRGVQAINNPSAGGDGTQFALGVHELWKVDSISTKHDKSQWADLKSMQTGLEIEVEVSYIALSGEQFRDHVLQKNE